MKPEGSLLCSQGPSTGLYPEPHASSPYLPTLFYNIYSILFSHLCLGLQVVSSL